MSNHKNYWLTQSRNSYFKTLTPILKKNEARIYVETFGLFMNINRIH